MNLDYFVLEDDLEAMGRWHLRQLFDASGPELDSREFRYGLPLSTGGPLKIHLWNSNQVVDVQHPMRLNLSRNGVSLDFTYTDSDMPVVTADVADLLWRIASADIQRFPVLVDRTLAPYEIINVVSRIDCIDASQSEIQWWEEGNDIRPDLAGTPEMITKLVIDPKLVQGHHIFRPQGWEIDIIVSDVIKNAFEEAHVSGVRFRRVSP